MSNYWASLYDEDDRLSDLERLQTGVVFDWLKLQLPAFGTAINWAQVTGDHTHWFADSDAAYPATLTEFLAAISLHAGTVIHEGDSLSPFPVRFEFGRLASVIEALLEIPEHHYFVHEQHRWVAVFRTEGHVDLVVLPSEPERTFAKDE